MLRALGEYRIEPLTTLIPFHQAILATEQWAKGETCRDLTEDKKWLKSLDPKPATAPPPPDAERRRPRRRVAERDYKVEVDGRLHAVKVIGAAAPAGGAGPRPRARAGRRSASAQAAERRRGASGPTLASPLQGTVLQGGRREGPGRGGGRPGLRDRGDEDGERDHRPPGGQGDRARGQRGRLGERRRPDRHDRGRRMADAIASFPGAAPNGERPDLPLPPGKLPLRRDGRLRKRWRYVGAFADELIVCAARVHVGPLVQNFWAVCDRESGEMWERTRMLLPGARGDVWTEHLGGEEVVAELGDLGVLDYAPDEGSLVRIDSDVRGPDDCRAFLRCGDRQVGGVDLPDRGGPVRVDPQARRRADRVDVRVGDRRWRVEARGMEDESAGYHPRHTVWSWSSGVGRTTDGRSRRLEPGRRDQRPARALRAGDLGRRRALGARPRRPSTASTRSTSPTAPASASPRSSSAPRTRTAARQVHLPPAVRHLQRHPPGRPRARARPGRHGVPRRDLVRRAGRPAEEPVT